MQAGAADIEDVLALSPLQQGLFSLAKLAGDGVDLYTMQFVADIEGPLDAARLRRSAEAMLARHPNLRASFWDRDLPHPVQIIPSEVTLPWRESHADPSEFEAIAEAERLTNFDLADGPLMRCLLVRTPASTGQRFRLILTVHHILMDAWSLSVFFRELIAVYQSGGDAGARPPPRPYRDYIGWLAHQDVSAAAQRWLDYVAPLSSPTMLAETHQARPGTVQPQRTALSLDRAATTRLTGWAREHGLTLNTALQFAWAVVLSRLTDRRDVAFGTVVSGRPQDLTGVETMVGLFINTVPVVVDLSSHATILEQCRAVQQQSAAMRDLGFIGLSQLQRAAGRGALFDTLLVFENVAIGPTAETVVSDDGVRFRPVGAESLAHYPLTVVSCPPDDELMVMLEAVPQAFPHLSVADIGERILSVLRQLPQSGGLAADALDVLLPAEHHRRTGVADQISGGETETVAAAFNRQADATPEAVALSSADGVLSYAELRDGTTRLARVLAHRGVGPEDRVALALPRSPTSVIAILSVLQAGAAYVPIDLDLPAHRIESILRQSAPRLTVTVGQSAATVSAYADNGEPLVLDDHAVAAEIAGQDTGPLPEQAHPDNAAYVIFTSGSTGEPKGVIGTHRALLSYFADHRERVYQPATKVLGHPLRIAHAWSLSFDASWQPLIGLLDGHAIHLFSTDDMRDAARLVDGIDRWRIDMIDTSPSMFAQLAAAGLLELQAAERPVRPRLTVLALGGEAIAADDWTRLRALPHTAVHNCYGPTETTVEAVVADVADSPVVSIGTAVRGMRAYVLDSALRPVPDGAAGELYLAGNQLTRGYLGRAAATATAFVANPYRTGERMYRTGDLVRWLPSGQLGYLGRGDDQVKVRGYRIEIAEVVAALSGGPGVANAAVVPVRSAAGTRLMGFVTGRDGAAPDLTAVRARVGRRLPAYMVPARIVAVDAMPLTPHGKLDTQALLTKAAAAPESGAPPSTDTERMLAAVLAEVFDGAAPGLQQDLFELGMDSIVAISLANKARHLGVTPRMVLANPTIELLAAAVDAGRCAPRAEASDDPDRFGEVAALPIVSWMYEYGNFRRFVQAPLITLPSNIVAAQLESLLQGVLDRHDMLRAQLELLDGEYRLITRPPGVVRAADILTRVRGSVDDTLNTHAHAVIERIDPFAGAMVQALWCDDPDGGCLLLAMHHLVTDAVSWFVLMAGLAAGWEQLCAGENPVLPGEYTTYREFARLLQQRGRRPEVAAQRDYWLAQLSGPDPALGSRMPDPRRDTWSSLRLTTAGSDVADTQLMLDKVASAGADTGVREFLLAALTMTLTSWRIRRGAPLGDGVLVALEGHGREDELLETGAPDGAVDTSSTAGWFTDIFPVRLGYPGRPVDVDTARRDPAAARGLLREVAERIAAVPNHGLDYGLLRYQRRDPVLAAAPHPQVQFNYVGRLDLSPQPQGPAPWTLVTDPARHAWLSRAPEPDLPLRYTFDVVPVVHPTSTGPQLVTSWRWSEQLTTDDEADQLAALWCDAVATLAGAL
ncbi:amino acid adenylation domain-containing protein [uncultured Mycobacterium sp.]|uniref:amino acid adenylation domain-containing protein n=1 Tax=uncultured Mycobacterium sp. TaxID=171292 RepID=UPI0035C95522